MFSAAARHTALRALAHSPFFDRLAEHLAAIIRKDDVVVELDGGLGLVTRTLLAVGCSHVYVVESSELKASLRSALCREGLASRATIVPRVEELADIAKVDVIITKAFPLGSILSTLLPDFGRLRNMSWFPSTRAVFPDTITIEAVPVHFSQVAAVVTPWSEQPLGLDLSPLAEVVALHPVSIPPSATDHASAPQVVAELDLAIGPIDVRSVERTFPLASTCELHGVEVCITAGQCADPPSTYFLPFPRAIRGREGEVLDIQITVPIDGGEWSAVPLGHWERAPSLAPLSSGPCSAIPYWKPRPHRDRVLQAVLREVAAGTTQDEILRRVYCALSVRGEAERRVVRQTVRALLCEGLMEWDL